MCELDFMTVVDTQEAYSGNGSEQIFVPSETFLSDFIPRESSCISLDKVLIENYSCKNLTIRMIISNVTELLCGTAAYSCQTFFFE